MLHIKSLDVKACRGILDGPTLTMESGGLLLYGENGTGKSSFIDAIEMVLAGGCSSLDIGEQQVSWKKHGRHIHAKKDEEVAIDLTLSDGNKETTVSLTTDKESLPNAIRSYAEAACQQSFLLRRRTMLQFIDAKNADRYKAVQSFLHLERYEKFEANLKELHKKAEARLIAKKEEKKKQENIFCQALHLSHLPSDDYEMLEAINRFVELAGLEKLDALNEVANRFEQIRARLEAAGDYWYIEKLRQLKQKISGLKPTLVLVEAGGHFARARYECLEQEGKLHGVFHQSVLSQGQTWIEEENRETCPLCEQSIEVANTVKAIKARLEAQQLLISKRDIQSKAHSEWRNHLVAWHEEWRQVRSSWSDLTNSSWPPEAEDGYNQCDALVQKHRNLIDVTTVEQDCHFLNADEWTAISDDLDKSVANQLSGAGDGEVMKAMWTAQKALQVFIEYSILHQSITTDEARYADAVVHLKKLCSLAEKARKTTVQDLLNRVNSIADGYFQQIHPGESIGKPVLQMKERGANSMELSTTFHDQQGDPRGHYSEGHVDSLGLCLFLAVRRLHYSQKPDLPLLVLDDVLHSVDGNHRFRTAQLIFSEFSDHQIIITTHDPLWFANLVEAAQHYGKGRKMTNRRIAGWTLESGPVWGDHLSDYEWLTSDARKVAAPKQCISRAGTLLEQLLQHLCHNLQASVVFDIRGAYTLAPLWNGFQPHVKKNKVFEAKVKPVVDRIGASKSYRNWIGAHHNEWASGATKGDADEFVNAVTELREVTYCPSCRKFIKKQPDVAGLWCCPNRCLQYDEKLIGD